MNNQGGDLYYLDYSFASGIEEKKKEQLEIKLLNPIITIKNTNSKIAHSFIRLLFLLFHNTILAFLFDT